jgi:hypothetical protein
VDLTLERRAEHRHRACWVCKSAMVVAPALHRPIDGGVATEDCWRT